LLKSYRWLIPSERIRNILQQTMDKSRNRQTQNSSANYWNLLKILGAKMMASILCRSNG